VTLNRSQFYQHFTSAFFVRKFVQSQTLSREKLLNSLSYKKYASETLMKLTAYRHIFENFWRINRSIYLLKGCQCCRLLEHHAALVGDQLLGRESRNIDGIVSVEDEDDEDEERDEAEDDFLFGTLLVIGKKHLIVNYSR